jgi:hypothetical protein
MIGHSFRSRVYGGTTAARAAVLAVTSLYRVEVRFGVHVRNDNRERTPPLVRLKAICGPGDEGEPVVTVMLPTED